MSKQSRPARVKPAVGLLAIFVFIITAATSSPPKASSDDTGNVHALLIGCTTYPGGEYDLRGPANDVAMFERLLTSGRLGVRPTSLSKLVGWPDDPRLRPTRKNIVNAFSHLIEQVGSGDQVVILLAGHGSQQPADDDSLDRESDGLDEIFLPADVSGWNRQKGEVEGAIVDDEIRAWVSAIQSKGAFVWIMIDACFSGTMIRGGPVAERDRLVPVESIVPKAALRSASRRARTRGTRGLEDSSAIGLLENAPGVVAMYAAQADERTPEMKLPKPSGPVHGLFSYTLAKILLESPEPMTYRELAERVDLSYRAGGRLHPTPLIEGGEKDRVVLGVANWPERPRLLLGERVGEGIGLEAGDLFGIRPGTVLEVYPPAGSRGDSEPLGHVRAVEVGPFESLVVPTEYRGTPAPDPVVLRVGCRASVVYTDYGEMRTKVAFQSRADGRAETTKWMTLDRGEGSETLEHLASHLERGPGALIERVTDVARAEWFVREKGRKIRLVPTSGRLESRVQGKPLEVRIRAGKGTDATVEDASLALHKIARVNHLLRIARHHASHGDSEGLPLEMEVLKVENGELGTSLYGRTGRQFRNGDSIEIRITNFGQVAADVTVLFINSALEIKGLGCLRIDPARTKTISAGITSATTGPENLLAIGVKRRSEQKVDLQYLAQDGLERTRSQRAGGAASMFADLLEHAAFGTDPAVRGLPVREVEDFAIRQVGWTVVPEKK